MKRTNLVLNEDLLMTATRIAGTKTYSATVNLVLEEFIRVMKIRQLHSMLGTVSWGGNLSQMREDQNSSKIFSKKNK